MFKLLDNQEQFFIWKLCFFRYNKIMNKLQKSLIAKGFKESRKITKNNAHTFYLCSLFLSKPKRLAAYSIYTLCRLADSSVDSSKSQRKDLEKIKKNITQCYQSTSLNDPILCAFQETVYQYDIPKKYFDELLDGMGMDLKQNSYDSFDMLYTYCYKVASIVGLVMLKIFGYTNPLAELHAVELGIAMQLTNILRDVKEDSDLGRIYIPKSDLIQHQVSELNIKSCTLDSNFKNLMIDQIKLARLYYSKASRGIHFIENSRCRFVTFLMMNLYADILNEIENNDYDVFSKKIYVPFIKKIKKISILIIKFFKNDFLIFPPQ